MARRKIKLDGSKIGKQVKKKVLNSLKKNLGLQQLLVSQAKSRMDDGRDTTHTYPDLWNHPKSYRRHPKRPLMATRNLYNGLQGYTWATGHRLHFVLWDSMGYGVKHQEGFEVPGPVPIPLTKKAARLMKAGGISDLENTDLKKGKDYMIAWNGVKVPQRKIFNMPPENVSDMANAIVKTITKMR